MPSIPLVHATALKEKTRNHGVNFVFNKLLCLQVEYLW